LAASSSRDAFLQIVEQRPDIGGRFRNLRRIGAAGGNGNFSLVFTAEDSNSGDNVAVKVYNPEWLGDSYRLECFRREAALLEQLAGQPDIVRLAAPASHFTEMLTASLGLAVPLQFNYYAVEPAGGDVLQGIAGNSWTPSELLVVFRTMCRAVQRIHGKRIAHRDVKPDNFLVMKNGAIKLSDFGAAALVDGSAPRMLASYTFQPGDRRYAAPEMIACLHDGIPEIAFAGDIYSLGAVLFELFTGQNLGVHVFDVAFWDGLAQAMTAVPRAKRRSIFEHFIDQMVVGRPLPSLRDYGGVVPMSIVDRLDRLYQGMAHLDYRTRLLDFSRIFSDVNACAIILRKEEAYRRWKTMRDQRRKTRLGRALRP
jgi:serine/threonine protein kinase